MHRASVNAPYPTFLFRSYNDGYAKHKGPCLFILKNHEYSLT